MMNWLQTTRFGTFLRNLPMAHHRLMQRYLQKRGWVTSKWGDSPTGRRARYYNITAAGRRQLGAEISDFDRVLLAINRVMRRA